MVNPRPRWGPGPTSYEMPSYQFMAASSPEDPKRGKNSPGYTARPYRSAPFASNVEQRRSIISDMAGDPGSYDARVLEDLGLKSKRSFNILTAAHGKASFNSRSTAWPRSARRATEPRGPGEYDHQHMYACGRPGASVQVRSSFKSDLPLGGHIRKSITPGVGSYDMHATADHVRRLYTTESREPSRPWLTRGSRARSAAAHRLTPEAWSGHPAPTHVKGPQCLPPARLVHEAFCLTSWRVAPSARSGQEHVRWSPSPMHLALRMR